MVRARFLFEVCARTVQLGFKVSTRFGRKFRRDFTGSLETVWLRERDWRVEAEETYGQKFHLQASHQSDEKTSVPALLSGQTQGNFRASILRAIGQGRVRRYRICRTQSARLNARDINAG